MLKKEPKIKKKMTIDDLAVMVKTGFDHVDKRLEQVDKRFEQADKRFDALENRIKHIENGVEDIKLKQDNMAYRFEIVDLQKRVKHLENKK